MATEQGRTTNDAESRLAQGAAGDESFRRQLLRTLKEVVCRDFGVGLLPGNLKPMEGIPQQLYTVLSTQPEGSLGRLYLGDPLYKVAQ